MESVYLRHLSFAFMSQTGTTSPPPFVKFRQQGGAVSTVTWVRAGWSLDAWLSGTRYFSLHYVQTSSGAHPFTYSVGSQGVEQMGLAADQSPPSSTEIKNRWIYTYLSPVLPHTVHRKNSALHFTKLCRITGFIKRCCFIQCRFWNCIRPTAASRSNIIHRYAAFFL